MYWYIKYPLLMLLGALLATAGWWSVNRFGARLQAPAPAPAARDVAAVPPAVAAAPVSPVAPPVAPAPAAVAPPAPAAPVEDPAVVEARLRVERGLAIAEEHLRRQQFLPARAAAEALLTAPEVAPFSPAWRRAAAVVSKANLTFFNSDTPCPEKIRITVRSGDTLIGLARRYHTTVPAIERNNKLDTAKTTLYPGMALQVLPANFRLVALKRQYLLLLYQGDKLFACWKVGVGRQDRTPVGTFQVTTRVSKPVWTWQGQSIPYGDPRNVLGTHWLGLTPTGETNPQLKGFGIHGTWEPESVGTAASEGCVRMRNEDVAVLFDMIPNGTNVSIRDE